jgi:hypothetical protein
MKLTSSYHPERLASPGAPLLRVSEYREKEKENVLFKTSCYINRQSDHDDPEPTARVENRHNTGRHRNEQVCHGRRI